MMLTVDQIRAGRALVRMTQDRLAKAADISVETVKRIEKGAGAASAHYRTIEAIRAALERAGIEFIDGNGGGPGVRLKKDG